ncbi:MAG TPA: nucleotidyltransferase family protein [Candidatus Binataceae bacterium]|nr:nucleotidyltransferase family protein [Candidatus Binataceae bacterium]
MSAKQLAEEYSASASPVARLMLDAVRVVATSSDFERIARQAQEQKLWEPLIALCASHRVLPLLQQGLRSISSGLVPASIRARLANAARLLRLRNLVMTQSLLQTVAVLEAAGVAALPFKGPVLAQAAYGDIGLREFDDLDLLVRPTQHIRALSALRAAGYRSALGLPQKQFSRFLLHYEEAFVSPRNEAVIDLHWHLNPPYFDYVPSADDLLARARPLPIGERQVPAMAPADCVLMLCVHSARHGWPRLDWLSDLARMIGAHPLDWEDLTARAQHLGCGRMLLVGLALSARLLNAAVPQSPLNLAAADAAVSLNVRRIERMLLSGAPPRGGLRADFLTPLRLLDHHRARFCLARLFAPTMLDWAALPLPPALFALYYLIHPLRIAWRAIGLNSTPN